MATTVEDLITIDNLTPEVILNTLRQRFDANNIYVNTLFATIQTAFSK